MSQDVLARAELMIVSSCPQNPPNHRLGDSMWIGYLRVSKADGSQTIDLQRDALVAAGVAPAQI